MSSCRICSATCSWACRTAGPRWSRSTPRGRGPPVRSFARPKSSSFATPRVVMKTLPGLTSRCTMSCACAAPRASAICRPRSNTSGSERGAFAETLAQRPAFQSLHGDERAPAVRADVVDGADVWMVEAREALGFTPESRQRLIVGRDVVGEELESDAPGQAEVLHLVDHAHAALPSSRTIRNRPTIFPTRVTAVPSCAARVRRPAIDGYQRVGTP